MGDKGLDRALGLIALITILSLMALVLVGCGKKTDDDPTPISESCINGFKYKHNGAYWVPKMRTDGWQERCF